VNGTLSDSGLAQILSLKLSAHQEGVHLRGRIGIELSHELGKYTAGAVLLGVQPEFLPKRWQAGYAGIDAAGFELKCSSKQGCLRRKEQVEGQVSGLHILKS